MKSIKRIRLAFIAILSALALAFLVIGLNLTNFLSPISAKAENTVVNGWNSEVSRGEAKVDLGTAGDNGFAKYTDLQSGDVVSYNGKIKSTASDMLVRTTPYRISIGAKGTGKIQWTLSTDEKAVFAGIIEIGGNAFAGGNATITNNKTFNSGDVLDIVIDGHHQYGSSIYYVDGEGNFTSAGVFGGYDGDTEFYLSVTVNEGSLKELNVKAGEGLLFTYIDFSTWTWAGYGDHFKAQSYPDAFRGIHHPANDLDSYMTFWAFKGYELSFCFATDDVNASADVVIGGKRAESDGTNTSYGGRGWYHFTVPADAENALVKITEGVGGWNSYVTRGEQQTKAAVSESSDYYTEFTGLQDGDVLHYNGTIKSEKLAELTRTKAYALSIIPTGTGIVTWDLIADGMTEPLRLTMVVDGTSKALRSQYGTGDSVTGLDSDKTCASGDTLTVIVDGHHLYNNNLYYLNADGTFEKAGGFNSTVLFDADGNVLYDEFKVSVTVTGEISALKVKIGEALKFTTMGALHVPEGDVEQMYWDYVGYNPPFEANFGNGNSDSGFKGIYLPEQLSTKSYWAFKGFPLSLKFTSTDSEASPLVTVGGQRVDSDGTASEGEYGWYNYTVSPYADSAAVVVKASDINVSFMDGETIFRRMAVGFGETVSVPLNMEKKGVVAEGYYTDSALTTEFDFTAVITSSTNVYIKWKVVPALTFMVGEKEYAYQNFEAPAAPTKPETDPVQEGMSFLGWYGDADGSVEFDFTTAVTENTTAYAVFGYSVTFRIIGFDDAAQKSVLVVKEGNGIAAESIPDYAEVTGLPAYDAFTVEWYSDETLKTKVEVAALSNITANTEIVGRLVDTKEYLVPNENGWDTQQGYVGDGNDETMTLKNYGSMTKMIIEDDGYTSMRLDYVGYIVNARRFDVGKDIRLSYEMDSTCDGPWTTEAKWIMFSMYNSANAAFTGQGSSSHMQKYGALGVFGFDLANTKDSFETWTKYASPVAGSYQTPTMKTELTHLIIRIGETAAESGVYLLNADNTETKVVNLALQRSMFPDGIYFTVAPFRITDISIRITQESSIVKGSEEHGAFTLSTTAALAGEKVYIETTPAEGYSFTDRCVFANGVELTVGKEDGENGRYYFGMPFGENVTLEVRYAADVTFRDGEEVVATVAVVPGNKVAGRNMPNPTKEGYRFDGWYKDREYTQEFNNSKEVIEDKLTVYAKWTAISYTITFVSDGSVYKTGTADYGTTFSSETISKEGYTFGGWYTDEACEEEYSFDTLVTGDCTVYAKWTANGIADNSSSQSSSDKTSDSDTSSRESSEGGGCRNGCKGSVSGIAAFAGIALLTAAAMLLRKKSSK